MNANLLRGKMAEKGVTLSELADNIGVSRASLSKKMNGKTEFSVDEANSICNFLELSPDAKLNIFLP